MSTPEERNRLRAERASATKGYMKSYYKDLAKNRRLRDERRREAEAEVEGMSKTDAKAHLDDLKRRESEHLRATRTKLTVVRLPERGAIWPLRSRWR